MARLGPLMSVPSVLRDQGVDPAPVLAELRLDLAFFDDPDNLLPLAQRSKLLDRCVEVTHCAHFGLLVGQTAGLSTMGVVGFLVQSAPSVREGLRLGTQHYRLQNPYAVSLFVESGPFASVSFASLQAGEWNPTQIVDVAVAAMFNMVRSLCGSQWQATEIHFAHARPKNIAPYRLFFRTPLVFDAADSGLVFASQWLDRRLSSADPLLHLMMKQRASELESLFREDVASQVRRMLPSMVTTRSASADRAAGNLGLNVRTLNRRLADEGTSFMRLRDEVRYSIARQLLQGSRMPASEIAFHLGYANAGAFTVAFERWSGLAPAKWRASKKRRPRPRAG